MLLFWVNGDLANGEEQREAEEERQNLGRRRKMKRRSGIQTKKKELEKVNLGFERARVRLERNERATNFSLTKLYRGFGQYKQAGEENIKKVGHDYLIRRLFNLNGNQTLYFVLLVLSDGLYNMPNEALEITF